MPVDSSKFGSQSSKMSSSGSGGSNGGSCSSVSDLVLRSAGSIEEEEDSKSTSSLGQTLIASDEFDAAIEESMELLEKDALESDLDEVEQHLVQLRRSNSASSTNSSGATTPSTEEESFIVSAQPPPHSPLTEEDIDKKLAQFNQSLQTRSPEGRANHHHVSFPQPPPLPTVRFDRYSVGVCRRRLSQCKEEENEEEEGGVINSALVAMKKSTSLNTDTSTGERGLFLDEEEEEEKVEVEVEEKGSTTSEEVKSPPVSRFTVTKTEHKKKEDEKEDEKEEEKLTPLKISQLRPGVEAMLRNTSARQNAQTIHFPCSTPVQNRISVQSMFEPHLDRRYFDSSLVEIRAMDGSSQAVNEEEVDGGGGPDDVWVKRTSEQSADVSGGRWNKY